MQWTIANKCYMLYKIPNTNDYLFYGILTREYNELNQITWVFNMIESEVAKLQKLLPYPDDCPILGAGLDVDYGYYQRHKRLPWFIELRIPDKRRDDLQELLDRAGLRFYDEYDFLISNHGVCIDNYEFWEDIDSLNIINREAI